MLGGGKPRFKAGDRVRDHKENYATVIEYIPSNNDAKSDRVYVRWDGYEHADAVGYYDTVFEMDN